MPDDDTPMGFLVTRGVSVRIPAGGLKIVLEGDEPHLSPVTIQVSLNMCPFWLEIALSHLFDAERQHEAVVSANREANHQALAGALEAEFVAGMQAIVAAATAIDALYGSVKEHAAVPADVQESWLRNGTARYKQVVEVLRRAFGLQPASVANLRQALKDTYRFRDLAVHPPSSFSAPVLHPDLGRGTEWRFLSFGFNNARPIVRAALAFTTQLASKGQAGRAEELARQCQGLAMQLDPLVTHSGPHKY